MQAQSSTEHPTPAPARMPTHILIIPDGNRRWARERGLDVLEGHEKGIENIGEVLKWCKEFGIRYVTLWGFSSENRNRSEEEVNGLMKLFESKLFEILDRAEKEKEREKEYPKVRIKFYGNIAGMPIKIQQYIRQLEEKTKENNDYFVSFLLNYGGAEELAECIRSIAEDYKKGNIHKITYDEIKKHLWTGQLPPPDVIIRTSGEYRLSGVMPVQSGYSELFFVKKYWPDFSKEDFVEVLNEYARRERRFGR